jgi:hypothetical protein
MLMLGFVALGIDVAKVMATRTQLQNAAGCRSARRRVEHQLLDRRSHAGHAIARAQAVAGRTPRTRTRRCRFSCWRAT